MLLQFYAWGWGLPAIPVLLAVPFMVAAFLIDLEHMILPDELNVVMTLLGALFVACRVYTRQADMLDPVFGAFLLTALFWGVSVCLSKWKGRAALGLGDIKFLPAAGLFIGVSAIPSYLAVSGALGIATAAIMEGINKKQAFPFGPALIVSLYLHVFLTGLGFDYTW